METQTGTQSLPSPRAVLLLIDVQKGFDDYSYWGRRNNLGAEKAVAQLLSSWRERRAPMAHIRHSSTNPDSPLWRDKAGFEFKEEALPRPDETVYTKRVNSGFIGTHLERDLRAEGRDELVLAGFTSDHCVSTTARMGANLGFKVWVVEDACVAFDTLGPDGKLWDAEVVHSVSMASLSGEFGTIVNSEKLAAATGTTTK